MSLFVRKKPGKLNLVTYEKVGVLPAEQPRTNSSQLSQTRLKNILAQAKIRNPYTGCDET